MSIATPQPSHAVPVTSSLGIAGISLPLAGLGFLSVFRFTVVGTMTLAEPLAACLLPVLVSERLLNRRPLLPGFHAARMRIICAAMLVSVLGYVLSDLYWGTALGTSAKGVARLVFTAMDGLVLWMLLSDRPSAWWQYLMGVAAGVSVSTVVFEPLFNDYWKFGFAIPVTYAVIVVAAFQAKERLFLSTLALLALSVAHVLLGYRSLGVLLFAFTLSRPWSYKKGTAHLLVLCLVSGAALATVGLISEQGIRKSTRRSDIERWTHIRFCLDGIARSPILGNGTWYAASGYVDHYYELLYRNSLSGRVGGFDLRGGPLEQSIHSQLLNSWCEGGMAGSAFFVVAFLLGGHDLLTRSVRAENPAENVRDFFLWCLLIGLIFSPFSGLSRWPLAFQLWFLLDRRNGATVNENPKRERGSGPFPFFFRAAAVGNSRPRASASRMEIEPFHGSSRNGFAGGGE